MASAIVKGTFSKRATEYDTERYAHSESDSESEVTGSGRVSGPIQTLIEGGSASATGTYDGHSTHDFLEQLRGHLESTHAASVEAGKAGTGPVPTVELPRGGFTTAVVAYGCPYIGQYSRQGRSSTALR